MQANSQPDSGSNATMRPILEAYYLGGSDAVRELRRANRTPDDTIETILAQLREQFPELPLKSTMPREGLESLLYNTYTARTSQDEQRIEWTYQAMKDDARWCRQNKYLMRAGFFEALAAIVKDEPVTMADDNPFKPYVLKLAAMIEAWKAQPDAQKPVEKRKAWVAVGDYGPELKL